MSETTGFKVGAFVSPLTASTTNSLLADADPALNAVLAYYKAMIQTHLGARWDAAVVPAGLSGLVGMASALAIPYDPLPFLTEAQLVPPMVALFVVRERTEEQTRNWYRIMADWKLQWVLPPLSPAQYLQLYPFLRAASKVILDRTEQGFDPTYLSGALVFELAGVEEIKIDEVRFGSLMGQRFGAVHASKEIFFPAVEMDLRVCERRMTAPGVQAFEGIDGTVRVADQAGSTTLIEFKEELT